MSPVSFFLLCIVILVQSSETTKILLKPYRNQVNEQFKLCSSKAQEVMGIAASSGVFQTNLKQMTAWKQDLHKRCTEYTTCLEKVIGANETDSVTKSAAYKQLESWKGKCLTMEFMAGKFGQCYDSIVFSKNNEFKALSASKDCETSEDITNKLESIIRKRCGLSEMISLIKNRKVATKLMCGVSVSKIFNTTQTVPISFGPAAGFMMLLFGGMLLAGAAAMFGH